MQQDIYRGISVKVRWYHRVYWWSRYKLLRRVGVFSWSLQPERHQMGYVIYNAGLVGIEPWLIVRARIKRFCKVHWGFKYRVLKLGTWFARRYLSNAIYQPKDLSPDPHDDNLRLFEKSFEEGLEDWFNHWYPGTYRYLKVQGKVKEHTSYYLDNPDNPTVKMLRDIKNIMMTVMMEDTAYRELFNMILLRVHKNMSEHYDDKIVHVMFVDKNSTDVKYFMLQEAMKEKGGEFYDFVKGRQAGQSRQGNQPASHQGTCQLNAVTGKATK